jgi:hypothetical protein
MLFLHAGWIHFHFSMKKKAASGMLAIKFHHIYKIIATSGFNSAD